MEEVKGYVISEQLDHIAYMFNVRTKGKKYENFIVNAIYTKVGNPDLMPVTQQYVKDPNDLSKYYLLDLYFPQIKIAVILVLLYIYNHQWANTSDFCSDI